MTLVDTVVYGTHLLFAAAWTGAVFFVTLTILPLARDGDLNAAPLERVTAGLRRTSRASAVVMLLTGGHMAGTGYTVERLTNTTPGYLVLAMVALWLVLMGLVEVGGGRLADGADARKVREPAREATPFLYGASVVAVLLLAVAAALLTGV